MSRRNENRRTESDPAVSAALGLVLHLDQRSIERRTNLRRRADARSVAEMLEDAQRSATVKTFALGGSRQRRSALYECGCVVVDSSTPGGQLHLLECSTHAALQLKLRRRQTDRVKI